MTVAAPPITLCYRAVSEEQPGEKLAAGFERHWPSYRRWYLREGEEARPSYAACARALRAHMPELVPTWERLVEVAGGGDLAARFLSLYRPPPYLTACSQAVWTRGEVALVRNYDYSPALAEGTILHTAWSGPRVIAMADCLWGVLDGINEAGVAVALAFGGRREVGDGFGIVLVLRYALERARKTAQAIEILKRVPVHMTYNVTVTDARGRFATVQVGPGRRAAVRKDNVSTNHQERVEWPEHARLTETLERARFLRARLENRRETLERFAARFFEPPLYRTSYERAWGTLYNSVYWPRLGTCEYRWPDFAWPQSFERFTEGERVVSYAGPEGASATAAAGTGAAAAGAAAAPESTLPRFNGG